MNGFDPYSPEFQAWHKQLGVDAGYPSSNLLQPDNSGAQAARMADPNYGNMMQSSGAAPVSTPLPLPIAGDGNATQSGGAPAPTGLMSSPDYPNGVPAAAPTGPSTMNRVLSGLASLQQPDAQPASPQLNAAPGGKPSSSMNLLAYSPLRAR